MIIEFNLPTCFGPRSRKRENAEALEVLLEALIALNERYLRLYSNAKPLYESGVVYGRTDDWLTAPACILRGFADCKSLTAWRIAERRIRGDMCYPTHRWLPRKNGVMNYHVLVENIDGTYEDPSKKLGMPTGEPSDNEDKR